MTQQSRRSVVRRTKRNLNAALGHLKAARELLVSSLGLLPPSAAEGEASADLETLDELAELHAVIACVKQDSLRPAIEDLRAVAGRRTA